ncbi:Hypothetical predicted protein [Octopus vulgaris]|uniref:Uncharacterized protein n=1 Tax=Octopus vulgaris TaxID=6645 RepID=A0AA36BID3_OCTVU|nr:Hypothetical predicted protein [Octopus vulgaris]
MNHDFHVIWVQIRGKSDKKPHLFTWTRNLILIKQRNKVLASRLQQWNLLDKDTRIKVFRKRSVDLQQFFTFENNLTYCNDIRDLYNPLKLT